MKEPRIQFQRCTTTGAPRSGATVVVTLLSGLSLSVRCVLIREPGGWDISGGYDQPLKKQLHQVAEQHGPARASLKDRLGLAEPEPRAEARLSHVSVRRAARSPTGSY